VKKLIFYILYSLSAAVCFCQTTNRQTAAFDVNRLEFGGFLGLSFGNYSSSVVVAPQVGYVFDKYFSAGFGVNYSYYNYSFNSQNSVSLNYMGLNVYGRIKPVRSVVMQIQPEVFRVWGSSYDYKVNQLVTTLLVGGGIIFPLGNNGGVSLMLYYDLIQDEYSPYRGNLFYSVGYTFSL